MPPDVTKINQNSVEPVAWVWMRYSAVLLIPLIWGHVILQGVIAGADKTSLLTLNQHWSVIGWRVYDAFLLVFACAHGVNGLRQVLIDFVTSPTGRTVLTWILIALWLGISAIGIIALMGGVRLQP